MVGRLAILIFILMLTHAGVAQMYEFTEPVKISVSSADGEESMPLVSPDGALLIFGRSLYSRNAGGELDGCDIWVSRRSSAMGEWRNASNTEFPWNDQNSNTIVGVNAQGSLYLVNGISNKKTPGIYFSKRVNNAWLRPELIPIEGLVQNSYIGVHMVATEDVIIISMRGDDSQGEEDLYVSLKDRSGKWSVPKNLGATVNTKGYEFAPFLSPDKKKLFFASNGHAGYGDADIFYCERLYNSWETWSMPKNLGDKINSKAFDAYFSMSGDSLAYFVSNRSGKLSDIYQAKAKLIWTPVATEGREYLRPGEVNELIGTKVQRTFTFEKGATQLTNLQQEHLWYIAGKVMEKKDVKIYLRVIKPKDGEPQEVYDKRLAGMLEYLQLAGLDPSRVRLGIEAIAANSPTSKNKGVVEILFYR